MRAQAAIEYLLNYFFVIVVISLLVGISWNIGFFNLFNRENVIEEPTNFEIVGYSLDESSITLELLNRIGEIKIVSVSFLGEFGNLSKKLDMIIAVNESFVLSVEGEGLCEPGRYYEISFEVHFFKRTPEGFSDVENVDIGRFRAICKGVEPFFKKYTIKNYHTFEIREYQMKFEDIQGNIIIKDSFGNSLPYCYEQKNGECNRTLSKSVWVKIPRIPAGEYIFHGKALLLEEGKYVRTEYRITSENFTISFWVRVDDDFNGEIIGQEGRFRIGVFKRRLKYSVSKGYCSHFGWKGVGVILPKDWVLITLVHDSRYDVIYVNGEEVYRMENPGSFRECPQKLYIGVGHSGDIYLDNLRIYNRSLSKIEIIDILEGREVWDGLEVYYKFDGDLRDYSRNGNEGYGEDISFESPGILGIDPGILEIYLHPTNVPNGKDGKKVFHFYEDFNSEIPEDLEIKCDNYKLKDGYIEIIDDSRRDTCYLKIPKEINFSFSYDLGLRLHERGYHYPFYGIYEEKVAEWGDTSRMYWIYKILGIKKYVFKMKYKRYNPGIWYNLSVVWNKEKGSHFIILDERSDEVYAKFTNGEDVERFEMILILPSSEWGLGGMDIDWIRIRKYYPYIIKE